MGKQKLYIANIDNVDSISVIDIAEIVASDHRPHIAEIK